MKRPASTRKPATSPRKPGRAQPFTPKKYPPIVADDDGRLPIPHELARDMGIKIGDRFATWKEGEAIVLVFPKRAPGQQRIPKRAKWGKVERALVDEVRAAKSPPLPRASLVAETWEQLGPAPSVVGSQVSHQRRTAAKRRRPRHTQKQKRR